MKKCPCDSKKNYSECCEPFLVGKALPNTPEELMRSRYTAFVKADIDYIANTMRGVANKNFDKEETLKWAKEVEFKKLTVLRSSIDKDDPTYGTVEFEVVFSKDNKLYKMHEVSRFENMDGKWFYVDSIG